MKFKVGDKVRLIKLNGGESNGAKIGIVGTIEHLLNGFYGPMYAVRFKEFTCSYQANLYHCLDEHLELVTKEGKPMATTLRQRVRRVMRSKDDQVLIDQGFTYESGALTKEGRKVVADLAFTNGLKAEVVKLANQLADEEKKKK